MASVKNTSGEARYIPLAGRVVEDGQEFEVADADFDELHFGDDFAVVIPPTSTPAIAGAELSQALKDAGLPLSGTADEKRERLADWQADQDNKIVEG